MKLILASGSPRRRDILSEQGLSFTVFTADFDEHSVSLANPEQGVQQLALGKAKAAMEKWRSEGRLLTEDTVFLGADTIVVSDGIPMGKPADKADAFATLKRLSGKAHQVYTGVALCRPEQAECFAVKTDVYFKPLSDETIQAYIATGEPMDKAGSYGIQGRGGELVEKIDGDYLNVVGLPAKEVLNRLQKL